MHFFKNFNIQSDFRSYTTKETISVSFNTFYHTHWKCLHWLVRNGNRIHLHLNSLYGCQCFLTWCLCFMCMISYTIHLTVISHRQSLSVLFKLSDTCIIRISLPSFKIRVRTYFSLKKINTWQMLINSVGEILSQYISHCHVHFKYLKSVFFNYASIKLNKIKEGTFRENLSDLVNARLFSDPSWSKNLPFLSSFYLSSFLPSLPSCLLLLIIIHGHGTCIRCCEMHREMRTSRKLLALLPAPLW